ncbi:MAG: ribonuclease HIII [Bacilli bacterium]|nr:ribonuclease HIII [Bacilli bacterium]
MITIKVTGESLKNLENEYADNITARNIGYILFAARTEKNIITAYDNKKRNFYNVTIQGEGAMEIAKKYSNAPSLLPKKVKNEKESLEYIDVDQQIGSDEVGTGDFFGPIVICSAYVDHDTMKVINDYEIADSKKISDEKLLRIVPLILKKVHYMCKVIANDRYNEAISRGMNMNRVKAIGHNHVLVSLHERCPYVKNIYVDQFVSEEKYYEYLYGCPKIQREIVFREKGETAFPSVALASCIARYIFLEQMNKIGDNYGVKIPLGAGDAVNQFAKEFINKFGLDEFNKIVKKNFKNYLEVINDSPSLV